MKRQAGFIVPTVLALSVSVAAMIYIGFAMNLAATESARLDEKKQQWIRETQDAVDAWYRRNAQDIEADSGAVSQNTVLQEAGVRLEYGAQFASTTRRSAGGIMYHNLAIWLPHQDATGTGLDSTTGSFNPGTLPNGESAPTRFAFINGRAIETDLYLETVKRMRRNASILESYFKARVLADPDSDSGVNYYRAADCSNPKNGELPCIDTHIALSSSGVMEVVGLAHNDVMSSWGSAVEISNLEGLPSGDPSISIRTNTPWGESIQVIGVRP